MNTETASLAGKYLTVALDREVYGLPVQVHHLNGCPVVTPTHEE